MPTSGHKTSENFATLVARRIWTADDKRRLVAEMAKSGANVSEISRRHGVANSLLYRWRQDAEAAGRTAAKQSGLGVGLDIARDIAPVFVPVAIAAPPQKRLPSPKAAVPVAQRTGSDGEPKRCGAMEIVLANGRSVRISADVDIATLMRIIDALEKTG